MSLSDLQEQPAQPPPCLPLVGPGGPGDAGALCLASQQDNSPLSRVLVGRGARCGDTTVVCTLENRLALCGEQGNVIVSRGKRGHCHSRARWGLSQQQGTRAPGEGSETHTLVTVGTLGDTWPRRGSRQVRALGLCIGPNLSVPFDRSPCGPSPPDSSDSHWWCLVPQCPERAVCSSGWSPGQPSSLVPTCQPGQAVNRR